MRTTRIATILAIVTILASSGVALASGPDLGLDVSQTTDAGSASVQALLDGDARYLDADVGAVTDDAAATVDTDASLSDPMTAVDSGAWTWLDVNVGAFAGALGGLFGLDPAIDGSATVYASDDGVDLDASSGNMTFDGSPAGDADGYTWEAIAMVKGYLYSIFG